MVETVTPVATGLAFDIVNVNVPLDPVATCESLTATLSDTFGFPVTGAVDVAQAAPALSVPVFAFPAASATEVPVLSSSR